LAIALLTFEMQGGGGNTYSYSKSFRIGCMAAQWSAVQCGDVDKANNPFQPEKGATVCSICLQD